MIWSVCRSICTYGLVSPVPAHHDDPDVWFSRPFLAGVLAFCTEEAVILPSEILSFSKPRSKSIHAPIKKLTDKTDSYKIRHKTILSQANWIVVARFRFEFLIARKHICFIVHAKMWISNKLLTLLICAFYKHENLDISRNWGYSLHRHKNNNYLVRYFYYWKHFLRMHSARKLPSYLPEYLGVLWSFKLWNRCNSSV